MNEILIGQPYQEYSIACEKMRWYADIAYLLSTGRIRPDVICGNSEIEVREKIQKMADVITKKQK